MASGLPGSVQQSAATKQPSTASATESAADAELTSAASTIEKQLPNWVRAWREIDPEFNPAAFVKLRGETTVPSGDGSHSPRQKDRLRELILVYSPDRSRFIDPYTGMDLWEEDGRVMAGFDVDSGVAIVDLRDNTWRQVLFCGTQCSFEDAAWIDTDRFLVVGSVIFWPEDGRPDCPEPAEEGAKRSCVAPALYVVDLAKNTVSSYLGPTTKGWTKSYFGGYLKAKFPNIVFD